MEISRVLRKQLPQDEKKNIYGAVTYMIMLLDHCDVVFMYEKLHICHHRSVSGTHYNQ